MTVIENTCVVGFFFLAALVKIEGTSSVVLSTALASFLAALVKIEGSSSTVSSAAAASASFCF